MTVLHVVRCDRCEYRTEPRTRLLAANADLARHDMAQHAEYLRADDAFRAVIMRHGTIEAARAAYNEELHR